MKGPFFMKQKLEPLDKSQRQNKIIVRTFLVAACVVAICMSLLLADYFIALYNDDTKQEQSDLFSINVLQSSLVDPPGEQYNIWFSIDVDFDKDYDMEFLPESGLVMKYDKRTESFVEEPIAKITRDDIENYSFVWVFETREEMFLTSLSIEFETNLLLKKSGIYLVCDKDYIGFLNKSQYNEYGKAVGIP